MSHRAYALHKCTEMGRKTKVLGTRSIISLIKGNLVPLPFNDVRVDDYMSAMIAIVEDVLEGLEQIDEGRLARLGLTLAELRKWQNA
ncbi:MAG: hypothetical protein S4CHLAM2_07560 [Chlamydiales bacterium]|nr:hypothetical protein [Chlamydiales bacterium]